MDQLVDQRQLQRFPGANVLSGENQIEGVGETDAARKALCAAGTRNQAELNFRKPENGFRMIRPNSVAARESSLESAAEASTVDSGNDRNPQPLQ